MTKYEDKELQQLVDEIMKERHEIAKKYSPKKENIFKRFLKKVLTF